MRASRTLALATVGIAAMAFAACSGAGDGQEISRSEFLSRGNAICAEAKSDILQVTRRGFREDRPPSNAELATFARQTMIPRLQERIDALRRLAPKAGNANQVDAILDAMQSALDGSRKQPVTFTAKDPYAKADSLARGYGLSKCVSG